MIADNPAIRVLIADDSDIVRRHLIDMLGEVEGVEVVGEAQDVAHTLDSVRTIRPEAVVLDVQMPDGTGITALKQIKQEYPDTLVIMLTNNANAFYRTTCLRAGASFFFDKSSEFEKVGEVLSRLSRAG